MKNRAIRMSTALGIMMILLLTPMSISSEDTDCGDTDIIDLVAGRKHNLVGSVEVSNDGDTIYVEYTTNSPWLLEETHLHIAASWEEIPQTKKGNSIPGKFEYSEEHDYITSYTYEIPFSVEGDLECGDVVVIAAHAVVAKPIPCREVIINCPPPICYDTETAWGDGDDFPGRDWSMYFTYEIECCFKMPDIPAGELEIKWTYKGPNSYWVAEIWLDDVLFEIPDDWDTTRTTWWSWCIDTDGTINSGSTLPGTFYLPDGSDQDEMCDWNRINHILNHKGTANWESVQAAIWHIWLDEPWALGNDMGDGISLTQAELDDAKALDAAATCCWKASPGDWVAMIFIPDNENRQDCIIEWDP